jgi:transcriptional regulator with XRE-family HTH domain
MTNRELAGHFSALRLTIAEAAQLLGVSERSVRRWTEGESVPGPVEAALLAWRRLDELHLPWKPDSVSVFRDNQDQISRIRNHDELLALLIREVEARGGPDNPWAVDLIRQRATFGPSEVGFHKLENGGFSPTTYRRLDRTPTDDDKIEIQDACYCIARAFAQVRKANKALIDVADYTRTHATKFAQNGASSLSRVEAARRTARIMSLADELDGLASSALEGGALYSHFETILGELHRLGFFPNMTLVSAVAHSMVVVPLTPSTASANSSDAGKLNHENEQSPHH